MFRAYIEWFVAVDAAVSIVPNGNSRSGNSGRFHRAVASGGVFFLCDVALGGGGGGGDGWWWWWWWWCQVVLVDVVHNYSQASS